MMKRKYEEEGNDRRMEKEEERGGKVCLAFPGGIRI